MAMIAKQNVDFPRGDDQTHLKAYNPEAISFLQNLPSYQPERLEHIVQAAGGAYAKLPLLTTVLPNGMSATLNYSEVEQYSANLARYFREDLKLEPGAVVAIQSPNCISYIVCLLGVLRAGLVLSNINPLYTEHETRHQLRDCKAQVLIGSTVFAETVDAAVAGTDVKHVLSVSLTDFFPRMKRAGLDFLLNKVKRVSRPLNVAHLRLEQAISRGAEFTNPVDEYTAALSPERDTIYQYSGGTTGPSKGVRLTEAGLITNIDQFWSLAPSLEEMQKSTMLLALPVYHVFGLLASIMSMRNGVHIVLIPSPRPLSNLKAAFAKFPPKMFPGVNTLFAKLMEETWFQDNPPNLTMTISGAAALDPSVGERWREVTNSQVIEGYGMTEATTLLTVNPSDERTKPGSAGLPLPGTEIAILKDDNTFAAPGEVGEIVAKGPQIMSGYLNRPEATRTAYFGGWMKTGDIGKLDDDGYLYIVDRAKDMVLVGGFNVFPTEVDEVLNACPGVLEAASVGILKGASEEELHAFVVRRNDAVTASEVSEYCAQYLTGYKRPRKVHFVDELPKSPIGKILRRELRSMHAAG